MKLSSLTENAVINDFLMRNELILTGLRRASKSIMENGYPKESVVVTFKEGPYSAVRGPSFLFENGEKEAIEKELVDIVLPIPIPYPHQKIRSDGPKELKGFGILSPSAWALIDWTQDRVICPLFSEEGQVVLIEQRWRDADGEKHCVRWSWHDDGIWRTADPDVFPLWGLDQLTAGQKTVFIHEGPKAATAGRKFYDSDRLPIDEREAVRKHPWYDVFSRHPHLGFIGGANRVMRTRWKYLKRIGVERVILVPDNDPAGRETCYEISKLLIGVDVMIMPHYPDYFPLGWDCADGWENVKMRKASNIEANIPVDSWEHLADNLIDITRMTEMVDVGVKAVKLVPQIVPGYPKDVAYIKETNSFTFVSRPSVVIPWANLGRHFAMNIDAPAIEKFPAWVAGQPEVNYDRYAFYPEKGSTIMVGKLRCLNLWHRTLVTPKPMTQEGRKLFDDYLQWVVPNDLERAIFRRWIATIIARPGRKHFGVILHSEQQGTGKSFLVDHILKPLIGDDYIAEPSAEDIVSRFTDWREGKILIYADEIAGTKNVTTGNIYNAMKTWITAPYARIEKKGQPIYRIEDYSKSLINSNKDQPLYIEPSDRRWMVIRGREAEISTDLIVNVLEWLKGFGLGEILWWALNFEKAVGSGEAWEEGSLPMHLVKPEWTSNMLSEKPEYIRQSANAPTTISKVDLKQKSTPIHFQYLKEVLDDIELGSVDGCELIPTVVYGAAVVDLVESRLRADHVAVPKTEKILGLHGLADWYYCDARRDDTSGQFPEPLRPRKLINGKRMPRTSLLINKAGVELLLEKYNKNPPIIITNMNAKKYVPNDGLLSSVVDMAKAAGIFMEDVTVKPSGTSPNQEIL